LLQLKAQVLKISLEAAQTADWPGGMSVSPVENDSSQV
jgi:hypothetical protein